MKVESPYLTLKDAAAYLQFPSTRAFYVWRYRHPGQLRAYRRGGVLLFKQSDLDASLEQERPARPHLKVVGR